MNSIGELVLYKNNQLIALNKTCGVAVQPDRSTDKSLFDLAEIYTSSKLHLIHRVDRPVSGVVLFAKNKKAVAAINEQVRQRKIQKTYLAIVAQEPEPAAGKLVHHLVKNGRTNHSRAFAEPQPRSKEAVIEYRTLASSERYHLLEVDLLTGRHHQIRAQLGAICSPVRGDDKYGFRRGNRERSIQLHAWKLRFQHPVSMEWVELVAPPPDEPIWRAFNL